MYLQVHVISSPAYDVLLGWPFDVLTESVVRNFDQTITIQDPNTGKHITVSTRPRSHKAQKCKTPGFLAAGGLATKDKVHINNFIMPMMPAYTQAQSLIGAKTDEFRCYILDPHYTTTTLSLLRLQFLLSLLVSL